MNSELYRIAAEACSFIGEKNYTNLGTTEFNLTRKIWGNKVIQVLTIAPTNELVDWLVNFNLLSWEGIKLGSYRAAKEIREYIYWDPYYPLVVTGFSKGAASAIAFKKMFNADYCVSFSPPPCLRRWSNREMENTAIFIDPDDPVSKAGIISFGHPKCTRFNAKDDHLALSVGDHDMEKWEKFVENMK